MSCPDCFSGHIHAGTPTGRVTKLHGLDVYVAEPPASAPAKGIVIIIPDAFGWEFVNNRILADHYAERGGYMVYLPEFMNGHAAPIWMTENMKNLFKTDTWTDWLTKPYHFTCVLYAMLPFLLHNRFTHSYPIVKTFFTAVATHEGAHLPIAAAGFCWGGKHTVNLASGYIVPNSNGNGNGKPLIDAAFTGHPSLLDIPAEIERMIVPVSFAIGDKDPAVKMKQVELIRQVVEGSGNGSGNGEVKVYVGAGHGFCVRADHVLEDAGRQAEEAEEQAIAWFERHFRGVEY